MSGIKINIPATYFKQEVVYKECWHNHAAFLGRIAYDGCLEFLPPTTDDVVVHGDSKEAMLCIACSCHRNFHRKEIVYNPIIMKSAATAIPQTHQQQPDFPTTGTGPSPSATRIVEPVPQGTSPVTATTNAENNSNNDAEEVPVVPPPKKRTKKPYDKVRRKDGLEALESWQGRDPSVILRGNWNHIMATAATM